MITINIQMIGLDITLTARRGHARQLLDKAQATSGVTAGLEADDL
jgi:hypothetical protein